MVRHICFLLGVSGLLALSAHADDQKLPLLFEEDFEKGANRWQPTDPNAWKIVETKAGKVYSQFQQSKYTPPHRSPFNFALLNDVKVGEMILEARLQTTARDYGHRDMCVIFGYQDSAHFYYVHLGQQTDDHANQIFIVNNAPRVKISTRTTAGTKWDDRWHKVRIVRRPATGEISIYFDDMEKPVMTATDKTFGRGQIGIGSFDDTGNWDDIKIHGVKEDGK